MAHDLAQAMVNEQTVLPGAKAPQKERPFLPGLQRPGRPGPAMLKGQMLY